MKYRIYNFLVNRKPGISKRYHSIHDGAVGKKKFLSYMYLLWMNFAVYVLHITKYETVPGIAFYEEKNPECTMSESEKWAAEVPELTVENYVSQLMKFDVISFDIFDTLIFRPLDQPDAAFWLMGEKFNLLDFRNIRVWAESDARLKSVRKYGHAEITLEDIWKNFEADTGLPMAKGMSVECEVETALCYANPFMLEVWNRLIKAGARIIVTSDMYLPQETIKTILQKNGYNGYEKLFLSNEYALNKASGSLFLQIKEELGQDISYVHVGDNEHSDQSMARKCGFTAIPYPHVNKYSLLYRPYDMSYMIGSAYRGIINNYIYNGSRCFSREYEYGFIYGGLFVTGYCHFIHEYCRHHDIEKVLFLSRDGDIIKKVYDIMYPNSDTAYVYWSRKAALKLMADEDRHDYFRRFLYHKVNQGISIRKILKSMELSILLDELHDWKKIWFDYEIANKPDTEDNIERYKKNIEGGFIDLKADDELTDKNAYLLRRFIEGKWNIVLQSYTDQQEAAKGYYVEVLGSTRKAVAVDIGWAGSGAVALAHLVEKVWAIPCEIIGIIAGTNTMYNAEPDASETFIQDGRLVSYMYSQQHNRDLLKKHDPNKDYNIFWEILLASPTPQFTGFKAEELGFGDMDKNQQGIISIQQGILDFATEYINRFRAFPYMLNISGRDAYAPIVAASGNHEKYLKMIKNRFGLEINVN